ncbi:hypothetical protein BDQ17DRAFT_904568 [Cyathus striatus]|nr:hypothetical protein BDQ17DRAFT_904568 [Cyathus striatus]
MCHSDGFSPSKFRLPSACTECNSVISKLECLPIPTSVVRSYYIPSQNDRSAIEDILFSSAANIRALEAELFNFQSRLSNIRNFYDCHRSLLSPMRRLPDDVLLKFGSCCKFAYDGGVWYRIPRCFGRTYQSEGRNPI